MTAKKKVLEIQAKVVRTPRKIHRLCPERSEKALKQI